MKSREILHIDNFKPLDVDITFLNRVSSQIPQAGYIDPAMAEKLATVCLQAADSCSDLLAQATLYMSHCDARRRSTKAEAISRALDRKVASTIVKEVCESDPDLQRVTGEYNVALTWLKWLELKRDTLVKTHHLCKDLIRKHDGSNTNWESSEISTSNVPSSEGESSEAAPQLTRKNGQVSWT